MNRKTAIIKYAIIEALVTFLIIALYLMGKLSLTGFIIAFGFALLVSMGVAFIIIRKTE